MIVYKTLRWELIKQLHTHKHTHTGFEYTIFIRILIDLYLFNNSNLMLTYIAAQKKQLIQIETNWYKLR